MLSSFVKYALASIIEACNEFNILVFCLSSIFSNILLQMSLSVNTSNALKTINNGNGCFTRGI